MAKQVPGAPSPAALRMRKAKLRHKALVETQQRLITKLTQELEQCTQLEPLIRRLTDIADRLAD